VSASSSPALDGSASQAQLAADRLALRGARRAQSRAAVALAQENAVISSSPLLSAQLDAQKTAFQLQTAVDDAAARRTHLEQEITALMTPAPVLAPSLAPLTSTSGSQLGAQAVSIAEQFLGVPYLWGGADPKGFDCSGLVMYVYAQLGIRLPHYAALQFSGGAQIDQSQLAPGDLVFFEPRSDGPGHVGIFVGGDEIIVAPHLGDVVKFASLSQTAADLGYVGAVRPGAVVASPFAPLG
jgi:cell wall-associated NlpC family hydrolase